MKLDRQQMNAVTTESKRTLILAGSGSGKTRVLIERIAYLIEMKKVSSYEILAFTFTRKAAGEVKERLETRLEGKAAGIAAGTMHAIALRMLHKYGDTIGLKAKHLTVYSQWETNFLLRDVAKEMGIYNGKKWNIPKKEIDQVFNHYYETGEPPEEESHVFDLFNAFIQRCRENNALTYGALLIGMRMIIEQIAKYQNWRYVFVDEVQDIDILQWSVINKLCESLKASLFVVGDIDQSLYEWRGAVPEYLIQHQGEFKIFKLETNYRSSEDIVEAANNLIEHNQERIRKTMKCLKAHREPIAIHDNMDSAGLVRYLGKLRNMNCADNLAVLCRIHAPLAKLSKLLSEAGIPHHYVGKKTALTNSEDFRCFHAFLKLIVNEFDNFSFLLIKDILGVSKNEYSHKETGIRVRASQQGKSHFQIYKKDHHGNDFATLCKDGLFGDTVLNIESIIDETKFIDGIEFTTQPIIEFIFDWIRDNPSGSIQQYLDWLATYDLQDELTKDQEGLQLMTVHAAKGLEWPTVIISGANEKILPSKQAINNGEIEAERRIAYVAWTRAEDTLIITTRPEQEEYKGKKILGSPPSRFIRESGL